MGEEKKGESFSFIPLRSDSETIENLVSASMDQTNFYYY